MANPAPNRIPPKLEQLVIDLYESYVYVTDIIKETGVSKGTLYHILDRNEIKKRQPQDHSKQDYSWHRMPKGKRTKAVIPENGFPAMKQAKQDAAKIKLKGVLRYFQATTLFSTSEDILPETKQILQELIDAD